MSSAARTKSMNGYFQGEGIGEFIEFTDEPRTRRGDRSYELSQGNGRKGKVELRREKYFFFDEMMQDEYCIIGEKNSYVCRLLTSMILTVRLSDNLGMLRCFGLSGTTSLILIKP